MNFVIIFAEGDMCESGRNGTEHYKTG